jgi:hypothetical protein
MNRIATTAAGVVSLAALFGLLGHAVAADNKPSAWEREKADLIATQRQDSVKLIGQLNAANEATTAEHGKYVASEAGRVAACKRLVASRVVIPECK